MEDIHSIRKSAAHYNMDASPKFWWGDISELQVICNGCGPENMPVGRVFLSSILQRYSPVWAIHDVDYEFHTCTRYEADLRLHHNMIKVWKKDFGFWRWLSIAGIFNRIVVIPAAYSSVRQFGKQAWNN